MKRALLVVLIACRSHDAAPKLAPLQRAVVRPVPPGPYIVRYNCEHSNAPFGKGGDINNQMIDLDAKTRVTTAYAYTDAPIAPPAPVVANLSPALATMVEGTVDRVLAGGPYSAELPPSEGTVCILTVAKGAQNLLVIEKADTKQNDAVSELVHVFRP